MTCQNRDAKGRFTGPGKMKDRYYKAMYNKGLYYEKNFRERQTAYYRKYRRATVEENLGPCICPKCEKKGYASLLRARNVKTGVTYRNPFLMVRHNRVENGRRVYGDNHFIGTCPLGESEN